MEDNNQIDTKLNDQEYIILEQEKLRLLNRINKYRYSWKGSLITFFIGFFFCLIVLSIEHGFSSSSVVGMNILLAMWGGLSLILYYLLIWGIIRMVYTNRLSKIHIRLADNEKKHIQDNIEENFFTKLVQLNFKYLDKYYLQTQIQADKSFWICLFAAIFSLFIIIVGIILMFLSAYDKNVSDDTTKISAYVVTASGILSEFIAAVFFYLYNQTILKMSEYHQKLVLTQNISLALKISEGLSEKDKQIESQQFLIKELTKDVNFHLMNNIVTKAIK